MTAIGQGSISVDANTKLGQDAQETANEATKTADSAVQIAGSKNRIYTDKVAPPTDGLDRFTVGDRWNVTDDSGVTIIAMYVFNSGKWHKNSWDALTLSVESLSALSANLGNVTAGSLTAVTIEGAKIHITSPGSITNPAGGVNHFTEDYWLDNNGFHERYILKGIDVGDGNDPGTIRDMSTWVKNGTIYFKNGGGTPADSDYQINVNGARLSGIQTNSFQANSINLQNPSQLRMHIVDGQTDGKYGLQVGTYAGTESVLSDFIYAGTDSSSSNMFITKNGNIKRSTSASKYKVDINTVNNQLSLADKLLTIDMRSWVDKGAAENYARQLSTGETTENLSIKPHYGLIAEDLRDAGLDVFLEYNSDGGIEGVQYDRAWIPLLSKIRDLQTKNNEYELRISKLEKKMEDLLNERSSN